LYVKKKSFKHTPKTNCALTMKSRRRRAALPEATAPSCEAAAMALKALRYVLWSVKAAEITVAPRTTIHCKALLGSTHSS